MFVRSAYLLLVFPLLAGCAELPAEPLASVAIDDQTEAILAVLAAQEAAWNDGSIRGFMEGYARTDSLRFASGGNIRTGWRTTLETYERTYPDAAAMGTLHFDDLDVRLLSDDWALVFGGWRLERAEDAPGGLFTLLMERRPEGWRVVHDHTSSASR